MRTGGSEMREGSRNRRAAGTGGDNEISGIGRGPGERLRGARGGLDPDTQASSLEGDLPSGTQKDMEYRQKSRTHGGKRGQRVDRAGTTASRVAHQAKMAATRRRGQANSATNDALRRCLGA